MSLIQLKPLYYSLVHPYITYACLAWGSGTGFKTQIKKVETKHSNPISQGESIYIILKLRK